MTGPSTRLDSGGVRSPHSTSGPRLGGAHGRRTMTPGTECGPMGAARQAPSRPLDRPRTPAARARTDRARAGNDGLEGRPRAGMTRGRQLRRAGDALATLQRQRRTHRLSWSGAQRDAAQAWPGMQCHRDSGTPHTPSKPPSSAAPATKPSRSVRAYAFDAGTASQPADAAPMEASHQHRLRRQPRSPHRHPRRGTRLRWNQRWDRH